MNRFLRSLRPALRLAAVLGCIAAAHADAQGATRPLVTSLRTGDTVRVWAQSPVEQIGAVTRLDADSLGILRRDGRPFAWRVDSLSHVDVQRGTRRSATRVVVGTLLGGAAGVVAGAYAGYGIECAFDCEGEWAGFAGAALGALTGGIAGMVTGGILGGRWRVPRWEKVWP
jgi:hypothetical protein